MTQTNNTTKAILSYLSLNGWIVWRLNNIAVKNRKFTGRRGVPDIVGFRKATKCITIQDHQDEINNHKIDSGKFIGIEIKTGKDKLSIDQLEFGKDLTQNNGCYLVAHSFDDFMISYNAWKRSPVDYNFNQYILLNEEQKKCLKRK